MNNYLNNEGFLIENVINHPDYHSNRIKNNIALIQFKKPISLENKTIKPACFYKSEEERTKSFENSLIATGWSLSSRHLQSVNAKDLTAKASIGFIENLHLIEIEKSNSSFCVCMF